MAEELSLTASLYYYPFEAAIAWCELSEDDARTVRLDMHEMPGPLPPDYPQWPELRRRAARILDAVRYGELPYGLHGKPGYDRPPLESELAWVTVRWKDLRDWMTRDHPGEKPAFLFSATERAVQADPEPPAPVGNTESDGWREDQSLLKREKQDRAVAEAIKTKGFNPSAIPDGEKGTIEALCTLEYPELFKAATAFETTWKRGLKAGCWRMQSHASYSKRGKD